MMMDEENNLKTDPSCRMTVREEDAVTADCDGVRYYFCSEGCQDKFLNERSCARTTYDLVIIGGGPAGLTAGVYAAVVERTACITNLQTYIDYKVVHFVGDGTLTGLTIRKMAGAETLDLPAKSVFIAVGLEPNSSLAAPLLKLNPRGEIIISPDCSTSYPGIFAAGDVTDAFGKRIIIASGEGAKAALSARQYLLNLRKAVCPPA